MMVNYTSDISGYFQICSVLRDMFDVPGNLPSKKLFINHIAILAFSIITAISTILLNLITILTFRASRQMRKNKYNYLIYIQSIIDLGIGAVVTPLFAAVTVPKIVGNGNCEFYLVFLKVILMAYGFSIANLSAMNFERYTSIVHPIYHRNKVTKKRISIYVAALCMLLVAFMIVSIPIGHPLIVIFIALESLLHLPSTVYFYWKIFNVGKEQLVRRSRVRKNQTSIASGLPSNIEICNTNKEGPKKDERATNAERKKEKRPAQSTESSDRNSDNSNERKRGKGEKEIIRISNTKKAGYPHGNQENELDDYLNHDVAGNLNECHCSLEQLDIGPTLQENLKPEYESSKDQTNTFDPQDNKSKHRVKSIHGQAEGRVGDEHKQANAQDNGQRLTTNDRSSADEISTREVLTNLKLAKSCLLVVICSFLSFFPPLIFSRVELDKYDRVDSMIIAGWCFNLFLLNSTLDSLIFFWKNKTLRKEAFKTLKKIAT